VVGTNRRCRATTTACVGDEGESTLTITGREQPGTVDVEVHDLEKIIVQLEVR
jgi:hypothetical protein